MKLVTVATHSERYFPVLCASAQRHGYDLVVLGWNTKWKGFTERLHLLLSFLDGQDPNEIIVVVDAYDVIVLQHANITRARFSTFERTTGKGKVCFGHEMANAWIIEYLSRKVFGTCQGSRLNAGTYIGRCQDIIKILRLVFREFDHTLKANQDDQILLTKICNTYPKQFCIDRSYRFFLVINGALQHVDLTRNAIRITTNKQLKYRNQHTPCFLHAIGCSNINSIVEKLGYKNPTPLTWRQVLVYDAKSIRHFMYYLIPQNSVRTALLCILWHILYRFQNQNK